MYSDEGSARVVLLFQLCVDAAANYVIVHVVVTILIIVVVIDMQLESYYKIMSG